MDALGGEPLARRVEQPVGDFLIVDTLEETEEPAPLVANLVVDLVQNPRNPSAHFPVAHGQERLHAVPLVERMPAGKANQFLFVHANGRNPMGIVLIKPPGKVEKISPLSAGGNRLDDELRHNSPDS